MRHKNRRAAWNIDVGFFSAAVTVAAKGGHTLNHVSLNILEMPPITEPKHEDRETEFQEQDHVHGIGNENPTGQKFKWRAR
jgi:hypothetical protein